MYSLDSFKEHLLNNEGKSDNTAMCYTYDLKAFFNQYPNFNRDNIISYLNSKNINAKSRNRILSSFRSYSSFLGLDNKCPVRSQDYISIQQTFTSPNNLTKKEVLSFINRVRRNESYRNYAIVMVLVNTGLRISEALSLKICDIQLDNNEALVTGKGNKQREIILNNKIVKIIEEYINNHRNTSKYAKISPYLFVSNKGIKLSPSTIQRIFNNYSDTITPHSLRHMFASNALENNVLDIRQLQQQLGHSKLDTVLIYTHPSKKAMKKSMNMRGASIG